MEIGNQIKQLRQQRSVTQEELAAHLGVTAQAVSKWERGAATPDIGMLPEISAYFGVTIDALFSLSDDTRMERIQNMLWDVRFLKQADVDAATAFLLDKAAREPDNGRPHELLADMENHIAREHCAKASEYAMEAMKRDPKLRNAGGELMWAMGGRLPDWNATNHCALIDFYEQYIEAHPDCRNAYMDIITQLVDDYRIEEAEAYCDRFAQIDSSYRVSLYRGKIAWYDGRREEAFRIWEDMERMFPQEWCVYHNMADFFTRSGRYGDAERYYRKAIDVQNAPRYCDPFDALAQFYEMRGDIPAAIRTLQEELDVCDREWNFTTGESADVIRREIARLERKCK